MLYSVFIQKDSNSDYGVIVPDLPGCISAGETPEEALTMIKEAVEFHIQGLVEDGDAIPAPTCFDRLSSSKQYKGGTWALIEVNLDKFMGPAERINITVPRSALWRIDAAARKLGMNRSQYLVSSALAASKVP